jgi:hypothetical protein
MTKKILQTSELVLSVFYLFFLAIFIVGVQNKGLEFEKSLMVVAVLITTTLSFSGFIARFSLQVFIKKDFTLLGIVLFLFCSLLLSALFYVFGGILTLIIFLIADVGMLIKALLLFEQSNLIRIRKG